MGNIMGRFRMILCARFKVEVGFSHAKIGLMAESTYRQYRIHLIFN